MPLAPRLLSLNRMKEMEEKFLSQANLQAAIWEVNLPKKESFVKWSPYAKFTFLHAHCKLNINKLSITIRQLNNTQIKMETGVMPRNRLQGDANFAIPLLFILFLSHHMCHIRLTALSHPWSPYPSKGTNGDGKDELAMRGGAGAVPCAQTMASVFLFYSRTRESAPKFLFL